jgi:regulation of enolase protein 1 (concanavalin A-like superfamily)
VVIPGFPSEFTWAAPAVSSSFEGGRLSIEAGPRTDLFTDPATGAPVANAPALLGGPIAGDFQLSARVSVRFAATYDAGGLLVVEAADRWAKLCFERSPQGRNLVVSVVNRASSDDSNGPEVTGGPLWLRLSRRGGTYALHSSSDGSWWDLVRYFALSNGPAQLGFVAQSPTGEGCRVGFDDLRFTREPLTELRDGS